MSGYAFMADVMRSAAESADAPTNVELERKAAVYDYLATLDQRELYAIFDSGAFNDVLKGYAKAAAEDLQIDPGRMTAEIDYLLSVMSAEQAAKSI